MGVVKSYANPGISQNLDGTLTDVIAAGNGTLAFDITPITKATFLFVRCGVTAGTCSDATIQIAKDAAFTNIVYSIENVDLSSEYWDFNSFFSDMSTEELHFRVTNNDTATATFYCEVRLQGMLDPAV